MRSIPCIIVLLLFATLSSCWKKQDIATNPPAHPTYSLSGTVRYAVDSQPAVDATVSLIMTELYQGDFLDTMMTTTDQTGYYDISGLYRGRYDMLVSSAGELIYSSEVGIIKYEDKIVDVSILPPDTTGNDSLLRTPINNRVDH